MSYPKNIWPQPSSGFVWTWDGDGALTVSVDRELIAGVDATGPWIDDDLESLAAGVDGTGPWIEDTGSSTAVGVDGTGPWIES